MSAIEGLERWRVLTACNKYWISDAGRVSRTSPGSNTFVGKLLKPGKTNKGYLTIFIGETGKRRSVYVHRAVIEAFSGPIPASMQVNHIDGDKRNNRLENLEVVTPAENIQHAWATGLFKRRQKAG